MATLHKLAHALTSVSRCLVFLSLRPARRLAALCVSALVALAGCDATNVGEAQRLFELSALSGPSGYSETQDGSPPSSPDADDWRTSPRYLSRFVFTSTPYPNPLGLSEVLQVQGIFSEARGAMIPYVRLDDGDLLRLPDACVTSGSLTGFSVSFSLSASCLAGGTTGLRRLVILDAQGTVLSYGDVLIAR